jgi:hypothetical protein
MAMAGESADLYKVRNRETLRRLDTCMRSRMRTKMAEPIPLDLSGTQRIVYPPIIDFLAHDPVLRAYVADFVPDPHVSQEQKESVYLRDGTDAARRIEELLSELSSILNAPVAVVKIAHAGGDSFDFYTADGGMIELHDSPSPQFSFDVYAAIQALSQEVQFEFIRQRRVGRVAG